MTTFQMFQRCLSLPCVSAISALADYSSLYRQPKGQSITWVTCGRVCGNQSYGSLPCGPFFLPDIIPPLKAAWNNLPGIYGITALELPVLRRSYGYGCTFISPNLACRGNVILPRFPGEQIQSWVEHRAKDTCTRRLLNTPVLKNKKGICLSDSAACNWLSYCNY